MVAIVFYNVNFIKWQNHYYNNICFLKQKLEVIDITLVLWLMSEMSYSGIHAI